MTSQQDNYDSLDSLIDYLDSDNIDFDTNMLDFVLENNPTPQQLNNIKNYKNENLLFHAISLFDYGRNISLDGEYRNKIESLLEMGIDVNQINRFNYNTLMDHAHNTNGQTPLWLVRLFVQYGGNIEQTDDNGETILFQIASFLENAENMNVLRFLLDNGANVNRRNSDDETPLMVATQGIIGFRSSNQAVQILLQYGADKGMVNREGETAYDIADDYFQDGHYLLTILNPDDSGDDLDDLDAGLEWGGEENPQSQQPIMPPLQPIMTPQSPQFSLTPPGDDYTPLTQSGDNMGMGFGFAQGPPGMGQQPQGMGQQDSDADTVGMDEPAFGFNPEQSFDDDIGHAQQEDHHELGEYQYVNDTDENTDYPDLNVNISKTIEFTDPITLEDLNVKIEDYVKEDDDNLVFVYDTNRYFLTKRSIIDMMRRDATIYPCFSADTMNPNNIGFNKQLFNLRNIGLFSSYPCNISALYENPQIQLFALFTSDKEFPAFISHDVLNQGTMVSALHCQAGSGSKVSVLKVAQPSLTDNEPQTGGKKHKNKHKKKHHKRTYKKKSKKSNKKHKKNHKKTIRRKKKNNKSHRKHHK